MWSVWACVDKVELILWACVDKVELILHGMAFGMHCSNDCITLVRDKLCQLRNASYLHKYCLKPYQANVAIIFLNQVKYARMKFVGISRMGISHFMLASKSQSEYDVAGALIIGPYWAYVHVAQSFLYEMPAKQMLFFITGSSRSFRV